MATRLFSKVLGIPVGPVRGYIGAELLGEISQAIDKYDEEQYAYAKRGVRVLDVRLYTGDPHSEDFPAENSLPSFVGNAVVAYADVEATEVY